MKYLTILVLFSLGAASCYYDKEAELYPSRSCTTTDIKYSTVIRPVVDVNCSIAGCHNAATMAGGYDLTSYSGIKTIADNGSFIGSITHAAGYSPMPKNGAKLADCQISQIKTWIDAGAPNN